MPCPRPIWGLEPAPILNVLTHILHELFQRVLRLSDRRHDINH